MPQTQRSEVGLAYFGLILTTLFWAGNVVVARGVADSIPPAALSFWRWFIALILILPFAGRKTWHQRHTIVENWKLILLLSALSVGFFNTLLYLAAQTTDAANIGLINSSMPVMVALLSWLVLGNRLTLAKFVGIFCALCGMTVIISKGDVEHVINLELHVGDLYMVLAVFFWSIFSVLLKRYPVPLPALEFLTIQIFMGVLVILPIYLLELALVGGFSWRPGLLAPMLYVAVFPGLMAYALWNYGVQRLGPQSAAMSAYLVPLFVALLAWWFLDETPALYHGIGAILILGGVFLATQKGSVALAKS